MEGSFQSYKYYRQIYFYGLLLLSYCNKVYGKRDWTVNINIIAVETINPFHSQVFRIGEKWINLGKEEFEDLLKRACYHKKYSYESIPELEGIDAYLID